MHFNRFLPDDSYTEQLKSWIYKTRNYKVSKCLHLNRFLPDDSHTEQLKSSHVPRRQFPAYRNQVDIDSAINTSSGIVNWYFSDLQKLGFYDGAASIINIACSIIKFKDNYFELTSNLVINWFKTHIDWLIQLFMCQCYEKEILQFVLGLWSRLICSIVTNIFGEIPDIFTMKWKLC